MSAKNTQDKKRTLEPTTLMMSLESRLMFDAAGLVGGIEMHDAFQDDQSLDTGSDNGGDDLAIALAGLGAPAAGREIIFIDASVADADTLLADVSEDTETVILDGNGISQITDALAGRSDITAVHIVSHGSAGALDLGGDLLDMESIGTHADDLAAWGAALADGADILFYGCNVAEGADGAALIDAISDLTGADVAASDDLTGDADQGGDWDLEAQTGPIDTYSVVSVQAARSYESLLALPVASNDVAFTSEDTAVNINVTANDTDADADTLYMVEWDATTTEGGTVSYNGNGVFSYTPLANYNRTLDLAGAPYDGDGTDDFTYTIFDGNSGTASATVTITVVAVADPPIVAVKSVGGYEDGGNIDILVSSLSITDTDGNSNPTVSGDILSQPATGNGTVAWDNGNSKFVWSPPVGNTEYSGSPSFTYKVAYGAGSSYVTGTVNLSIAADNDVPVLGAIVNGTMASVAEDTASPAGTTVETLLSNGAGGTIVTDPDAGAVEGIAVTGITDTNGTWQYTLNGGTTWTGIDATVEAAYPGQDPSDGKAVVLASNSDTKVRFVPDAGYSGTSGNITIRAWDQSDGASPGDVVDTTAAPAQGGKAYSTNSETASLTVSADNDAPVITSGAAQTVAEDGTLTFAANFFGLGDEDEATGTAVLDPNTTGYEAEVTMTVTNGLLTLGDTTGLSFIGGTANGEASLNFTGSIAAINTALIRADHDYDPTADYDGSDTLTITVEDTGVTGDATGLTDTATVAITVTAANDAPTITYTGGAQTVNEDTAFTFTGGDAIVFADPDASTSSVQVDLVVTQGTLTLGAGKGAGLTIPSGGSGTAALTVRGTISNINTALDGLIYQGDADYTGADTLTVTIDDLGNSGAGVSETASTTVSITVSAVNDDPVLTDKTDTFTEVGIDTTETITVVDVTDTDGDGDTLYLTGAVTASSGATITINNNGTGGSAIDDTAVDYVQAADYYGTDTITYHVTDGTSTSTGTLTITVNPDLTAVPVVVADTETVNEDASVTRIVVVDDDGRVDPAGATVVITVAPDNGGTAVVDATDNSIDYTPAANFSGTEVLTYELTNTASGLTDTGTLTITVNAANDAPSVTVPTAQSVLEDTPLNITGISLADVDSASGNIQVTLEATAGTLMVPSNTGALTLTSGVNDGTSAALTYSGTLTNLNTALAAITYQSDSNTYGTDTITITVDDLGNTGGGALTDTATISVTVAAVDDAPTGGEDLTGYTVAEDASLTIDILGDINSGAGYVDSVDGDIGVTVGTPVITGPDNGSTITVNANGSITYEPGLDFSGTEVITYTITDSDFSTNTPAASPNTVTVTVTPSNDAPVASNDTASTDEGTLVIIDAKANDSDPDGTTPFIRSFDSLSVSGGRVALNGLGRFSYTPPSNFNGNDTFTYVLSDLSGATDTATVTVTINANVAPTADNESGTVVEDGSTSGIDVLTGDSDPEGGTLTITDYDATSTSGGTVTFNSNDNTFSYAPAANYNGLDTFTYTISDPAGATDTGTVTYTVTAVNDAPIAENDTVTTNEDEAKLVAVLANDYDTADSDTNLTVSGFDDSGLTKGTVLYNGDGTFTYTPSANESGTDVFSYTMRDTGGLTDTASVTVTILQANDAPVATADVFGDGIGNSGTNNYVGDGTDGNDDIDEDTGTINLNVLRNDTDVDDGSNLMFIPTFTSPANGTLVYKMDKTFDYTPNDDFAGTDTFTYTLMDGLGGVSTGTVSIVIDDVPDNPSVGSFSKSSTEGSGALTFVATNFSNNFSDVDGNGSINLDSIRIETLPSVSDGVLKLSGVAVTATDVLTIADIANLTFVPINADWSGTSSFTWNGYDGTDWSTTAATTTISYSAVNDTPVVNVPSARTVIEENTLTVPAISITDPDGGTVQVTLNALHGDITIGTTTNLNFDPVSINGGSTVSFTGALTDVNTALGTVSYVGDSNFFTTVNTAERIQITVNDLANGGGTALQGSASIAITVTNAMDDPVGGSDSFSVEENSATGLYITQAELMSNDTLVETETGSLSITGNTSTGNGTLTYMADYQGLGAGYLYAPNQDFTGTDTFNYTLDDTNGTDSVTVTISVSAVNSAPVLNGVPGNAQEVYADQDLIISGVSVLDVDIGNGDMQVSLSAANGNISLNQTLGLTKISGDNGSSTMEYQGSQTAINNALSSLTYSPTAASGDDTITIQVNDLGGTGAGGEKTDVESISVSIREVNSDPVPVVDVFYVPTGSTAGYILLTTDVTENDTDANSATLYVASFTQPDAGRASGSTVDYAGSGQFRYTLGGTFTDYDFFTYSVNDGEGSFIPSTIYILDEGQTLQGLGLSAELEEEEVEGGVMMAAAEVDSIDQEMAARIVADAETEIPVNEGIQVANLEPTSLEALFATNLHQKMDRIGDAFESGRQEILSALGTGFAPVEKQPVLKA
ncbi:MAG: tandem-95 repeat protein [Magnetococcales bacterium]|nr:tandem-95 repeat protein [Magnetococcales bacterium]